MNEEYCCERFAERAKLNFNSNGGFERDNEEPWKWNINGCCGGGCYVVQDIEFCPFCGTSLFGYEE